MKALRYDDDVFVGASMGEAASGRVLDYLEFMEKLSSNTSKWCIVAIKMASE